MKAAILFLLAAAAAWPASRPGRYAVVLEEPPAAKEMLASGTAKNATRAAMATAGRKALAAQAGVRKALSEKSIPITGANHFLANVIFVQATAEQAQELQSMPGVAYVEKLHPIRPRMNRALDLIKVAGAWSAVNGQQNAGAGVKIGVLDTGIDQSHPAFQEGSLQYPSGFPKCDKNRGDCAFTNRKVIAARSYVNMLVGTDPKFTRPDDLSPRDHVGHGTAVAMVAAGARSDGPLATISGVAPAAWLGNYKVFGSPGVNDYFTYDDVLLQAIEDAQQDGMNMVILSIGAPAVWGATDRGATCNQQNNAACDFRADAIENAANLGMLTVVAAGNSGDMATKYPSTGSIESPGTAPSALTVGGTTNSHILYQTLRVQGSGVPSGLQQVNAMFGDGPKPNTTLTAPVRDVAVTEGSQNASACSPLKSGSLTGAIALIERGGCEPGVKINYAQRAGAVGVIIHQRSGFNGVFTMTNLGQTGIPAVLIGNNDGVALKSYIAQHSDATATLDTALRAVDTSEFDTMAVISSRGPSIRTNAIKPEVVAVGTDLYVATQRFDLNGGMYDPSGFTAAQGTSFSAAMAAGVSAIVWQRNPQWLPRDIKSAIVNTADNRIQENYGNGFVQASVLDQGAGIVNAGAAVQTNVTVFPATLSFGVLSSTTTTTPSIAMTICNRSNAAMTLSFAVRPSGNQTSMVVLTTNTLSLAANTCDSQQITARLVSNLADPGIYEGAVVITGGAVPLRVPYLYLKGDGAPSTIQPLQGIDFVGAVGSTVPLMFKVMDRYGVPVANSAITFQSTVGGGSINSADSRTDALGIGFANAVLGSQPGAQEFYASAGSSDFGVYFQGRAQAIPTISNGGIVNAASGQLGSGIAPGSYISIFGSGLSEAQKVFSTPYLPLSLSGVSVSFDVPSKSLSLPGRLHFVSDGQINVQVPWELQGASSVVIKVSIGENSSATVTVPVAAVSPAAFEYAEPSSGSRLAAALDSGFALIGSGNAAQRGQVIQIYANGLGPVDNQPASGDAAPAQPLATSRTTPTVTIGGQQAEVMFSGLAPQYVGLYQLNVRVPDSAPTGLQPLVISVNGIDSKPATLPVR